MIIYLATTRAELREQLLNKEEERQRLSAVRPIAGAVRDRLEQQRVAVDDDWLVDVLADGRVKVTKVAAQREHLVGRDGGRVGVAARRTRVEVGRARRKHFAELERADLAL